MENRTLPATLLVVDDNTDNLRVVGSILKEHHYKIAFAMSAKEALQVLEHTPVDLILLDIMMPVMDGYELCTILKANKKFAEIPIIFLTARAQTDDIVNGFRKGGVDYVTKPYRQEELICRVQTHIELKIARDIIKKQARDLKESNRFILRTLHQFGNLNFPSKL